MVGFECTVFVAHVSYLQAWRIFQQPHKFITQPLLKRLFAQIASTRKDVECTFGRIKNRFRMLKLPLMFDDLMDVRALFVTCCVLHNMLLQVDSDNYDEDGLHSEAIIGNTMCAPFVLLAAVVVVVAVMFLLLQTVMMIVMMSSISY